MIAEILLTCTISSFPFTIPTGWKAVKVDTVSTPVGSYVRPLKITLAREVNSSDSIAIPSECNDSVAGLCQTSDSAGNIRWSECPRLEGEITKNERLYKYKFPPVLQ